MDKRLGELQGHMLSEQPDQPSEVVTVNRQGGITERSVYRARQFVEPLGNSVALEMVLVPGGTFMMGSPGKQGYDDEHPQHEVTMAPFLMGRYPVTQAQWEAIVETKLPCRFKGGKRPVENVSWNDAREFCERLSKGTGRTYLLPSEAQWEHAGRAQTTTPFHCGETITTDLANYRGEFTYLLGPPGLYRHQTTEVGSLPPNAFGLYDMHGNVWEWCADPWHGDYVGAPADGSVWMAEGSSPRVSRRISRRVLRGGSWHDGPDLCRCAARLQFDPRGGDDFVGLRAACPQSR